MTAPTRPSSRYEAALAPARFSYRQAVLGCGGSERFAQVSLVGEKGRFAVVVRHTLRSQSTNPKPCCRASPAYSGPYLRAERGGGPRHHHYIPHGVWARGAGGIIMAKKCARTFSIVVEKGKKSILDVTHALAA